MTNPNSIVRLHSRKGGRGSVHEANMAFQVFGTGLLSGSGVVPATGLTVTVGGSAGNPDIAVATSPDGYKIALDIVGTTTLTIAKPSSNKRYTAIVAYTDDLSLTSSDTNTYGNPSSCGLIQVNGTISASPSYPTDSQIRTAITNDGATGSQASYAVVGYILMASNTSTISSGLITIPSANLSTSVIAPASIAPSMLDMTHSTDSNGWEKTQLASNLVMYTKKESGKSISLTGHQWSSNTPSSKPTNLNTAHSFFGVATAFPSDKAINMSGMVTSTGDVSFQVYNAYEASVSTTFDWTSIIFEFLS